mgnify:CR=1 FL=1
MQLTSLERTANDNQSRAGARSRPRKENTMKFDKEKFLKSEIMSKNDLSKITISQPSEKEIEEFLDIDTAELLQDAEIKILTDDEIKQFVNRQE